MTEPARRRLLATATVLSLGHHLDHVVRGTHTGWPVTPETTPFTWSLAVYPLVLLGVALSRSRWTDGYWMALSGAGAVFLLAVHLGPVALEPPGDITGGYQSPVLGWAAFGWLLCLIAVLLATFVHEVHGWRERRRAQPDAGRPAPTTRTGHLGPRTEAEG